MVTTPEGRPMRLAVITSKYPARVATFFERDMRALLEAGVEIDVFSLYPQDDEMSKYRLDILDERVLPPTRLHHLGLGRALRSFATWQPRRMGRFLRDAAAVTAAALRYGPGPLAKTGYVLPKAWYWALRQQNRWDHVLAYWGNYAGTCAYVFHRLLGRQIPFSLWLHAGTDLYDRPIYLREKMRHADNIITCCDFNRRYIMENVAGAREELAGKIHVCYHGLDLSTFPFRPEGRPPHRIVAVGRLARDKGFNFLLLAARELRNRNVEVEVELVGDGKERGALENLARELQIDDRVHFRGWVPFAEARRAMSEATILVHPSGELGDGLPNVIREAMALGTPVIASRIAGIPEALDDGRCGILVPPRDVRALADAISRLLSDAGLRNRFAEDGRQRTEQHFDMWKNGHSLAAVLRSVRRDTPSPLVAAC